MIASVILKTCVRCTEKATAVQIYRGQISADLFRPTSYDGSGFRGTMEAPHTAQAISATRTLLASTAILITIPSLSILCSSVLTETLRDFGLYLQFITLQVRAHNFFYINSHFCFLKFTYVQL